MRGRLAACAVVGFVVVAAVPSLVAASGVVAQSVSSSRHATYVTPPIPGAAPFPSCPSYGVIGSRGSDENNPAKTTWAQGLGPPAHAFAEALGRRLSNVQYTANPPPGYPAVPALDAVLHKSTYIASVNSGATQLDAMLKAQEAACSDKTRVYLAGYSQGAELSAAAYRTALRHDPWAGRIVAGVVLFGDPLFNRKDPSAGQTVLLQNTLRSLHHNGALTMHAPWHVGAPDKFPYITIGNVLSYCRIDDYVCQGIGGNPLRHEHDKYPESQDPADAAGYFAMSDAIARALLGNWKHVGTDALIGEVRIARSDRTYALARADIWFPQAPSGPDDAIAFLHRVRHRWKVILGPGTGFFCSDLARLPRSVRRDFKFDGPCLHRA